MELMFAIWLVAIKFTLIIACLMNFVGKVILLLDSMQPWITFKLATLTE